MFASNSQCISFQSGGRIKRGPWGSVEHPNNKIGKLDQKVPNHLYRYELHHAEAANWMDWGKQRIFDFQSSEQTTGERFCGENEQSDRIVSSLHAGDVSGDEDTRTPTEWRREAQGRSTKGYLDLDRRALGSDGGGAPKKVASAVRSIRCPEITTRIDGAAA